MKRASVMKEFQFIELFWRNKMKDYGIFYSYKNNGDSLVIVFDTEKEFKEEKVNGRVHIYYENDRVIGYKIDGIKEFLKIKNKGEKIFFPNNIFIDVINSILINAKCEPLEPLENSGYFVGQIKDIKEDIITVSLGNKDIKANKCSGANIGDKVVVALPGTMLNGRTKVKEYAHICLDKDLNEEGDNEILLLDKDAVVGEDFFTLEVK